MKTKIECHSCRVCDRAGPFLSLSLRDGIEIEEWYCIHHAKRIFSPEKYWLVANEQIGERARLVARFIRQSGRAPSTDEDILSSADTAVDDSKFSSLSPELRKWVERLEATAAKLS